MTEALAIDFTCLPHYSQLRDPESSFSVYSIIIALEAVAMVIPPILPTAILIGLNVSGIQHLQHFLVCAVFPAIIFH